MRFFTLNFPKIHEFFKVGCRKRSGFTNSPNKKGGLSLKRLKESPQIDQGTSDLSLSTIDIQINCTMELVQEKMQYINHLQVIQARYKALHEVKPRPEALLNTVFLFTKKALFRDLL